MQTPILLLLISNRILLLKKREMGFCSVLFVDNFYKNKKFKENNNKVETS